MAAGNDNQQQNNNQLEQSRKIAGTNVAYTGMIVKLGEFEYTTMGGGIEGDRQQLEPLDTNTPELNIETNSNQNLPQDNINPMPTSETSDNTNPVTRTFVSRVTYYRQDGTTVARGTNLHQHQDGTIMLGHDPNNMGAIVTTTNPNPPIGSGNGGSGNTTPGGPRNNNNQMNQGGGGSY